MGGQQCGRHALAAQHPAPQVHRRRAEHVVGQRGHHDPVVALDLARQLLALPARVAGEHPQAAQPGHQRLRVGVQVDQRDRAAHADHAAERRRVLAGAQGAQAQRRLLVDRAADEHRLRPGHVRSPRGQHVVYRDLARSVQHDTEGALPTVIDDVHHGSAKIGIHQARRRDQQGPGFDIIVRSHRAMIPPPVEKPGHGPGTLRGPAIVEPVGQRVTVSPGPTGSLRGIPFGWSHVVRTRREATGRAGRRKRRAVSPRGTARSRPDEWTRGLRVDRLLAVGSSRGVTTGCADHVGGCRGSAGRGPARAAPPAGHERVPPAAAVPVRCAVG